LMAPPMVPPPLCRHSGRRWSRCFKQSFFLIFRVLVSLRLVSCVSCVMHYVSAGNGLINLRQGYGLLFKKKFIKETRSSSQKKKNTLQRSNNIYSRPSKKKKSTRSVFCFHLFSEIAYHTIRVISSYAPLFNLASINPCNLLLLLSPFKLINFIIYSMYNS
jgi:hypothetical protein